MIDQASVFAERFKGNPQVLQATVLGQGDIPGLDPYTALNALRLIKESNAMQTAAQAQQPTSSPSIVAENMAPPPMQQGLGAMVPNTMGQAPQGQAPQGQAPQGQAPQAPQAPVMQASGGLAGMPVPEEDYAAGGIVAFQEGGLNSALTLPPETPYNSEETGVYPEVDNTNAGTGSATERFNSLLEKQIATMQGRKAKKTSPTDQDTLFAKLLARETTNAGPDIYAAEIARGAQEETDRGKRRKTGEAMALLTAAGAVLKGRNLSEGASNALPAYASAMNEVDRADQAVKSANAKMQFALKDAQRKERAGNVRAAIASMESYRKFQQDENKAEFDLDNAVANLAAKGVMGNRTTGKGAGAGAGPKVPEQLYADNVANMMMTNKPKPGESQDAFTARIRALAGDLTARQTRASTSYGVTDFGPNKNENAAAIIKSKENLAAQTALAELKFNKARYKKYVESFGGDEAKAVKAFKQEYSTKNPGGEIEDFAFTPTPNATSKSTNKKPAPPAGFIPD